MDPENQKSWYDSFSDYEPTISRSDELDLIKVFNENWDKLTEALFYSVATCPLVVQMCSDISNVKQFARCFQVVAPDDSDYEQVLTREFEEFQRICDRASVELKRVNPSTGGHDRISDSSLRARMSELLIVRPKHPFLIAVYNDVCSKAFRCKLPEQDLQSLKTTFQCHEDAAARLYDQHAHIIHQMCDCFLWPIIEREKKLLAAKTGFAKAIARYDSSRGYRLWSYAVHWVARGIERAAAE